MAAGAGRKKTIQLYASLGLGGKKRAMQVGGAEYLGLGLHARALARHDRREVRVHGGLVRSSRDLEWLNPAEWIEKRKDSTASGTTDFAIMSRGDCKCR